MLKCAPVCRFTEEVTVLLYPRWQLTTQSWGWEESVESGVIRVFFPATQRPGKRVAGRGQTHKQQTTLSVISDSLGTLWATQRSFMQSEKRVHLRTGNCKRLCAQCYQEPPFLLCEYFKCSFGKQINSLQSIWRHDFYRDSTAFSHTGNRLQGERDILSGLLERTGFILSS